MQNRTANIQLGGKPLSPNKYLQKAYPPQQAITLVSSHRLPGKLSPSKYKVYTTRTSRQPSNLTSENSIIELKDSSVLQQGNYTPVKPQSPLRDASNLTVGSPRHLVRVNFVGNSPNCSRTSSIHARQLMASPGKMMGVEVQARDEVLERRLRVLEGRIGELHREKHEMAGKLNEENRKVYHENTSLKLKVNDLLKKMEKNQTPLVTIDRKAEAEAESLRANVTKLEEMVSKLTQKSGSLIKQCQQLKDQLQQSKQFSQQLQTQNQSLSKTLQQKQAEYDSLHYQYLQISEQKLQLLSQKQHYEQQFQQIQTSLAQTSHGNTLIVEEYESKLQEYRVAYDRNQEVIEQLSQQLQLAYSQQQQQSEPYPPEEDAVINAESEGQLAQECKDLQSNFLLVLEQREQQLHLLQGKNQELSEQLDRKAQEVEELNGLVETQAGRLEDVAGALQRYTAKMQEMEGRYEQLRQRHELQVQKGKQPSPPPAEKCKKCEELTKTIFRLNSHLNKRI